MREPQVTFPMRELDRLKTIQAVVDGDLKPGRAAEWLGLTRREMLRLTRQWAREAAIRPLRVDLEPTLHRLDGHAVKRGRTERANLCGPG